MIRYALFDLDGTLVDSGKGIIRGVQYSLEQMGWDPLPVELIRSFIGPPLTDAFSAHCGMSEKEARQAVVEFRKYYSKIGKTECRLYDGIPETLSRLTRHGLTLFVATSKPTLFSTDICRMLQIDQYFAEIAGSNLDNTRSKKREVIQYLLDRYSILDKASAVMIGDKASDLAGARQCGIPGIGVSYGFGSPEELAGEPSIALVSSPAQLGELLCQ